MDGIGSSLPDLSIEHHSDVIRNQDVNSRLRSKSMTKLRVSNPSPIPSPRSTNFNSNGYHSNGYHHSNGLNGENMSNGDYLSNHYNNRHHKLHHHHRRHHHGNHGAKHQRHNNLHAPLVKVSSSPNAYRESSDDFVNFQDRKFLLRIDDELTGRVRSFSDTNLDRRRTRYSDSYETDSGESNSSSLSGSPIDLLKSPFGSPKKIENGFKPVKMKNGHSLEQKESAKEPNSPKTYDKVKMLSMIENLIVQTDKNYKNVETQVNDAFKRIEKALENRRNEMLEKAKGLCDEKKESLYESKARCEKSRKAMSRQSSFTDSELNGLVNSYLPNGHSRIRRSSVDDHDDILQGNKILEPWKNEVATDESNDLQKEIITLESLTNDVFSDQLEEGNLSFQMDEEVLETILKIGEIKESLSSPQVSFVKGLAKGFAIEGNEVKFEIFTRNLNEEIIFNKNDKVEVFVVDPDNKNVLVDNLPIKDKFGSSFTTSKSYMPAFTPETTGVHKVHVMVNTVEIYESPFDIVVYPKLNLMFDQNYVKDNIRNIQKISYNMEKSEESLGCLLKNVLQKQTLRREASEDSEFQDSEWILQKGGKSSLLLSSSDVPSYIYSATEVHGICAWQIRVTSACTNIMLTIGVGTRSGIPDIDESFACHFSLEQTKQNDVKKGLFNSRFGIRKSSSFTRNSTTYDVLLNTTDGFLSVISEETDEEKKTEINLQVLKQFKLYPFCSMVHNHGTCAKAICPRPQITLV